MGVDAPVVPVSKSETTVDGRALSMWAVPHGFAVGWHDKSARAGKAGNTVLNGHNTNHAEVLRDLYKLQPDDEIILCSEVASYTYTVSQALVFPEAGQPFGVRLRNARYAAPTDDERSTLVTCHPYGSLRNRLVVIAHPASQSPHSEPPEN